MNDGIPSSFMITCYCFCWPSCAYASVFLVYFCSLEESAIRRVIIEYVTRKSSADSTALLSVEESVHLRIDKHKGQQIAKCSIFSRALA